MRVCVRVCVCVCVNTSNHSTGCAGVGNVEWVVNVLVIADQLLLTRLKDLCEHALASSRTSLTTRGHCCTHLTMHTPHTHSESEECLRDPGAS